MILTFRHLLEKHKLGEQIFEIVKTSLSGRCMTMREGTIDYPTLIAAAISTKNKEGKRDPEMHQTKKAISGTTGWSRRLAKRLDHTGVDKGSGLIQTVVKTAANVHDLTPSRRAVAW
jgi:IS5 family transposase